MHNKYINKHTYEIVDDVFEVDEDIAKTISVLNKKGYHTLYSCSGHVKDSRLYEKYPNSNSYSIYDSYNIDDYVLIPYQHTEIYIMFEEAYNFNYLPDDFILENGNIIYKDISYYNNGKKLNANIIQKEINISNEKLYEWASGLPNKV